MFLILICIISILSGSIVSSEEVIELTLGQSETIKRDFTTINHFINFDKHEDKSFLKIKTTPTFNINPAKFYVSQQSEKPSPTDFVYASEQIGINTYYIPVSSLTENNIYITVQCINNCDYQIIAELTEDRFLIPGEELTFQGTNETHEKELFYFDKGESTNQKVMVYYYTNTYKDITNMEMTYYKGGKEETVFHSEKTFNGYAFNEDISTITNTGITLTIEIPNVDNKTKITIGLRYIDETTPIVLYQNTHFFLNSGAATEICYNFVGLEQYKTMFLNINYLSGSFTFSEKKGKESVEYLINYGKYITLLSDDYINKNEICFKIHQPENQSNESFKLTVSFQVLYEDSIEQYQEFIPPVINQYIFQRRLPFKQLINYHHYSDEVANTGFNFHLTNIKGEPVLYGYICSNYPCTLTNEEFLKKREANELITSISVNDDYVLYSENQNIVYLAYCESFDKDYCEYTIDLGFNSEDKDYEMNLIPEMDYYSYGIIKNFKAKIEKTSSIDKVLITVESMKESCYLIFPSELKVTQRDARGKIIYQPETIPDFLNFSLANDNNDTVCFINVEYDFSDQVELRTGIENIEQISLADGEKFYTLVRRELSDDPYAIKIEALNCYVDIIFNEKEYKETKFQQIILHSDTEIGKQLNFDFSIRLNEFDVPSSLDDYCTIMLSGVDTQKDNGLIMTEGTPSNLILDRELSQMTFILPLIKKPPFIFIDLDTGERGRLDVIINIDDQEDLTFKVFKSQFIDLEKEYTEKCKSQNCNVWVSLMRRSNDPLDIPVKVWYKYLDSFQPVYLHRNSIFTNAGFTSSIHYYYTDIGVEDGEVVIDFKKGGGLFYAKLVKKKEIEEGANWNKRVLLPKEGDQFGEVDQIKGRFTFTKEDTKDCENGCELYIAIQDDEKLKEDYTGKPLTLLYSISIRIGDECIEVPDYDEYTLGYLNNKPKCYRFTIKESSQFALITLNSFYGNVYINEGTNIPSETEYKFKITMTEKDLMINSTQFTEKESLEGITLTVSVIADEEFANEYSFYQFRYLPLYGNIEKETVVPKIKKLTSEQEERCETEEENGSCLMIVHVNKCEDARKIYIFTYVEENPTFALKIYGNVVNQEVIDKNEKFDSIIDLFPTNTTYDLASEDKAYLSFTKNETQKEEELYVLIRVVSPYAQKIKVATSTQPELKTIHFNPHNNKLFFAYHDLSEEAGIWTRLLVDTEKTKVSYQLIAGKSDLFTSYKSKSSEKESSERQVINEYNYNINKKTDIQQFKFRHEGPSDDFVLGKLMELNGLLNKLREGDNMFDYSGNIFPNAVYFPIPKNKMNFTIWYYLIESTPSTKITIEEFRSDVYIVPEDFIKRYMIDPTILIEENEEEEGITINFIEENNTVVVNYYNSDLNLHYGDYLFIRNRQIATMPVTYSHALINYFAFIDTNYPLLEQKKYRYNYLSQNNKLHYYRLTRDIEDNHIFEIELEVSPKKKTEPDVEIKYSFEKYKDYPKGITEPEFNIKNTTRVNGKKIIIVEVEPTVQDPIILTITFEDETKIQNLPYVIKYKTVQTFEDLGYEYNTEVIFTAKDTEGTISFNEIFTTPEEIEKYQSGVYIARLYKENDFNKKDLESIYDQEQKGILPLWVASAEYISNFNKEQISLSIQLPDNGDYIINVVGHFVTKNDTQNEEISLSLSPSSLVKDETKADIYVDSTVSSTKYRSFLLKKKSSNDLYYNIEIASEPLTDAKQYINFALEEQSDNLKYINITGIESTVSLGRRVYNVKHESNTNLVISFFKSSSDDNKKFTFKYTTAPTNSFPKYTEFDGTLREQIIGNDIYVEFTDITKSLKLTDIKSIKYIFNLYKVNNNFLDDNTINTIYSETTLVDEQKTVEKPESGSDILLKFLSKDIKTFDYKIMGVASFDFNDGRQEKIGFTLKTVDKSKEIIELETKQYIKQTFVDNHAIYVLKYNKSKPILNLEIGQDLSLANKEKYEVVTNIEKFTMKPSYKNNTDELKIISDIHQYGKNITQFTYENVNDGDYLLLIFTLHQKTKTIQDAPTNPSITVKYTPLSEGEQLPSFVVDENFSANVLYGTLTVKFVELKSKDIISSVIYNVSIYDKASFGGEIKSVSINDNERALKTNSVKGESNNGKTLSTKFTYDVSSVYVSVVAEVTTKSGEKVLIGYGIKEVSSTTLIITIIIVIICLIAIGIVVFFVRRCLGKKKLNDEILKLESEKINEVDKNEILLKDDEP